MHVVSTNTAEKKAVQWRGKTIYTGIYKSPTHQPIFLGKEDVKGDHVIDRKYHGGIEKACYIYSADYYDFWSDVFPDLDFKYGMFGENITIKGLNDLDLQIGDQYEIGKTVVEVTQPRFPCYKLGIRFKSQSVLKKFIQFGRPGAYLKIIQTGSVKVEDEVKLIRRGSFNLGLVELNQLNFTDNPQDMNRIKTLLKQNYITEECKEGMRKRLKALKH